MGLATCQTVEDGAPRMAPREVQHGDGDAAWLEIGLDVQVVPGRWSSRRLVIRACRDSGEVTAALEPVTPPRPQ